MIGQISPLICNSTLSGQLENEDIDTKLEYAHLVGDFVELSYQIGIVPLCLKKLLSSM